VDIDPQTFNLDPGKLELAIQALKNNDPSIYPLLRVISSVDVFSTKNKELITKNNNSFELSALTFELNISVPKRGNKGIPWITSLLTTGSFAEG
jgi:hypothetical protein